LLLAAQVPGCIYEIDMFRRFTLNGPGFLSYFRSAGGRRDLGKSRVLWSMFLTFCAQLLLGCATTRSLPTDYVLGTQGGPAQPANSGPVKVYVDKAEVPAYLARRNLASIEGDKVRYSPGGLWAAPLDETIALAVATNLSNAGISALGFQPVQRPPAHTLDVIIRFPHFEGRQTGDVVVAGRWRIVSATGATLATNAFSIRRSGWKPGGDARLVALLSEAVLKLSLQIAKAVPQGPVASE
jgi:uncharacterized lipoprotein YmbA